jgi:hypothetical protein
VTSNAFLVRQILQIAYNVLQIHLEHSLLYALAKKGILNYNPFKNNVLNAQIYVKPVKIHHQIVFPVKLEVIEKTHQIVLVKLDSFNTM